MIPNDYTEWKSCIERDCGIQLTTAFAKERIQALTDRKNPYTESFIKCYGMPYYQQVMLNGSKRVLGVSKTINNKP